MLVPYPKGNIMRYMNGALGYSLDRDCFLSPNVQVSKKNRVQLVDGRKVDPFVPEEFHHVSLTQDTNNVAVRCIANQQPMNSTTENLHGLGKIAGGWEGYEGFCPANRLDFSECDGFAFLSLSDYGIGSFDLILCGFSETNDHDEVGIEILEIEGRYCCLGSLVLADEYNARLTLAEQ